jgi:hypothetical protein
MSWTNHYSPLDRAVHRIAFSGVGVQKAVADIEDRVFAGRFADVAVDRPVFITSLPRAGTTLLLELIADLPEFAAHTYRHMPFLLCPLFILQGFQQKTAKRARAHDDGVIIDCDSVEAFEEALWQAWWPGYYCDGHIRLCDARVEHPEFEAFFTNHLRKIVALGRDKTAGLATRYVSKNNDNVARIPYLAKLFPDCRIVVPVRAPLAHVMSLHRQHMRFLGAHADDAFAKVYMQAIGHREFGENLMPIAFPGFDRPGDEATDPAFWLDYWIAAFSMLASLDLPQVRFVSFEDLVETPGPVLDGLLRWLEPDDAGALERLAGRVTRPSSERRGGTRPNATLAPDRLAVAEEVFSALTTTSRHRCVA